MKYNNIIINLENNNYLFSKEEKDNKNIIYKYYKNDNKLKYGLVFNLKSYFILKVRQSFNKEYFEKIFFYSLIILYKLK